MSVCRLEPPGDVQEPQGQRPHCMSVRELCVCVCVQPGLTKIRDTDTLFNLLKRDQGHVGLFLHFVFQLEVGYLSCH